MACGLACTVSRLPGVTDTLITDRVDGVLVEPRDRRALAQALQRLLGPRLARYPLAALAMSEVGLNRLRFPTARRPGTQ